MVVYRWKKGSVVAADPQVAGEVCAELERSVGLTQANLVEASRDEDAPLHGCFEWDDEVAAEKYRENQAGYIIRSLEAVVVEGSDPQRAFLNIVSEGARSYSSTEVLLRDETSREAVLAQAMMELEAFRRKYAGLEELAELFAAMDSLKLKEAA